MNDQWRDFLVAQGAVLQAGEVAHFGDAAGELQAAAAGGILAALADTGVIIARGPDAAAFLQGQLTNDLRQVDHARGQISGYCSPKGRLLAVFIIAAAGDEFRLLAPAALVAPLLERLTKYRLRAKVELHDGAGMACAGLAGAAAGIVADEFDDLPAADYGSATAGGVTAIRLPGAAPRFIAVGETTVLQDLWRRTAGRLTCTGPAPWRWLDIRAGIPVVVAATQDEFVPQAVNLDALGGISLKKGCYTGQEIVARLHYLGRLKQRMFIAHSEDGLPAVPGSRVFGGADAGSQAVGTVVAAQADPAGGRALLAVLPVDPRRGGSLHLSGPGLGPPLSLETLPYAVPDRGDPPAA